MSEDPKDTEPTNEMRTADGSYEVRADDTPQGRSIPGPTYPHPDATDEAIANNPTAPVTDDK